MQNPALAFLNKLNGKEQEAQAEESKRRNDPWHAYRSRPITARMVRRAKRAEMVRITRKYHANIAKAELDFNRITETEAVRRVREWEAENGSALRAPAVRLKVAMAELSGARRTGLETIEVADLLGLLEDENVDDAEAAE